VFTRSTKPDMKSAATYTLSVLKRVRKKRNSSILAFHDCPFPLNDWFDPDFSMSWLEALSLLEVEDDWKVFALASTGEETSSAFIRGVNVDFYPKEDLWVELFNKMKIQPDILLLNIMDYNTAVVEIKELVKAYPNTKIIFRIHHEPFRLAYQQTGFIESLMFADLVISPLPIYNTFLTALLNCQIVSIPFGAKKSVKNVSAEFNKSPNTILSVTKNLNPGKNFELVRILHSLSDHQTIFNSYIDISKEQLNQKFAESSHFLQPSLSEASGSRILLEAVQYGLVPICFEACLSATYVIKDCGGIVIPHKFRRDYLQKKTMLWEEGEVDQIKSKIVDIIQNWEDKVWHPPYFDEQFEIRALALTLKSRVSGDNRGTLYLAIEHVINSANTRISREEINAKYISF
jgi:hypothetical protein